MALLRWLLRLILALLAIRFVARRVSGRPSRQPPFDPAAGGKRAKARDHTRLSPYEIDDADYEEIPRG